MIEVYSKNRDRAFFTNVFWRHDFLVNGLHADFPLDPTEATYNIEFNGTASLNVTCPIEQYFIGDETIIEVGSIVRADVLQTTYFQTTIPRVTRKQQLFSVYSLDINSDTFSFVAEPLFYRLLRDKFAIDVRPTQTSASNGFSYVVNNSFGTPITDPQVAGPPYHGEARIKTAYYQNMTDLEALQGTQENSIRNRWLASVAIDNWDAYIWADTSSPPAQKWSFQYGKDLTGLSVKYDGSAIVRWIRPKGYNGITMSLNYTNASGRAENGGVWAAITQEERQKFSPKKEIEFQNVKMRADVQEDEDRSELIICDNQTQVNNALYNEAVKYFDTQKIDEPIITIDIDVVDLSKNLEVPKELRQILKNNVGLGDIVNVYSKIHNVNITAMVISVNYDCIAEEITDLTLSNSEYDFFNLLNETVNTSKNVYKNR